MRKGTHDLKTKNIMQGLFVSFLVLLFNSQIIQAQEAQVDATNFYDYFKGNEGGAQRFPGDLSNGEITLTPDEKNKVGGVTLKNKIGLDQAFVWKGRVGIGTKSVAEVANADGISAIFHTAEPGALGATGANMGAGGLPNALGFKFDTYINTASPSMSSWEAIQHVPRGSSRQVWLNWQLGWEADGYTDHPGLGYGAFIHTYYDDTLASYGIDQKDRWRVKIEENTKVRLPYIANANVYYPIDWAEWIIEYQPEVNGGTMTVTYKVPGIVEKVWTRSNIKTEYNAKGINAVSFAIQSSTGDYSSFHQIAFDSFSYRNVTAQLKFDDQAKVYDAKNAQYQIKNNNVRLVKYVNGNEQPVNFPFTSEDFVVLDDAQQIPSDVGKYRVVLSEHGKQRLAELEKQEQIDLGDLDVYKANYQITPRKVTVQANNQKLTLKQAKESLYKNDYTEPSDEVFNQDLANRRLNVAVAYDSSVQPQNFKVGETYPKILVPNVSGQALKNYEVKKVNGDVTIGRTQVKLADGQHVYDGKSARYTQSPITLVYTDDKGEEQVLDYTFDLLDLQFLIDQQPTSAIHVHDGGYQVVLSEKGKEKITKIYQEKQLELPDLDVVAKYTITPRAVTITALDQNVTKSQLLEGTIDTQKYVISDELFQKEVQESVKGDAKNGVSVQLNPAIDYHEHIDAAVIENALIPKLAEDKLVPEKLTNLAKDYQIAYINGKVKVLADIPNTRVDLVSSRVSLVSLGIASMLLGYFVVPKAMKGRRQAR